LTAIWDQTQRNDSDGKSFSLDIQHDPLYLSTITVTFTSYLSLYCINSPVRQPVVLLISYLWLLLTPASHLSSALTYWKMTMNWTERSPPDPVCAFPRTKMVCVTSSGCFSNLDYHLFGQQRWDLEIPVYLAIICHQKDSVVRKLKRK
jgi:hypothetical protein